jgi:ATP-dependent DNA ligase
VVRVSGRLGLEFSGLGLLMVCEIRMDGSRVFGFSLGYSRQLVTRVGNHIIDIT